MFSQRKPTLRQSSQKSQVPYVNPYEILGVQSNASEEDIRTAFREQSKKNHPDLVTHMSKDFQDLAEEKVRQINWAYQEIRKHKGF